MSVVEGRRWGSRVTLSSTRHVTCQTVLRHVTRLSQTALRQTLCQSRSICKTCNLGVRNPLDPLAM